MENTRKLNWTKQDRYSLINEIEAAGEVLIESGNSADINGKKRSCWGKTIPERVDAVYSNNK